MSNTLEDLLQFVRTKGRTCPQPQRWNELYEMLPGRVRRGNGWVPSVPLILAAWYEATPEQKAERLREHVEWAAEHDCLEGVGHFLRGLPEEDWFHRGD